MRQKKLRVVFYDEATAVGGSLVVLSHLFKEIDRNSIEPKLISALSVGELRGLFDDKDICWAEGAPMNYVTRARWVARVGNILWRRRLASYLHLLVQTVINSKYQCRLLYLLVRMRPDVIHINNGVFPFVIAWMLRVPIVFHLHAIQSSSGALIHWGVRKSKAFVAISSTVMQSALDAGYPACRVHLIPNPAPRFSCAESKGQIRSKFDIPLDRIVFTHVGRVVSWKGQIEFLKAFEHIMKKEELKAFALIVGNSGEGFGSEYEQILRAFVRAAGLEDSVGFLGFSSEVLQIMYASDVIIHSSTEPEPFGLVVVEAMAVGTPVIASNLGAPKEIVTNGVDGIIVSPVILDQFSAAIEYLAKNETVREKMGRAGLATARDVYAPSKFAEKMTSLYLDLIRRG